MRSAVVDDFDLATHGFAFGNWFPGRPALSVDLPIIGEVVLARASGGLCGGMSYTSLDYYSFDMPSPRVETVSDPLYEHIRGRQLSSLDIPAGILRYYNWQTNRDDSLLLLRKRIIEGISYMTLKSEWPRIRRLLDGNRLAPLGLIKSDSLNPAELSENHQVLAYGYTLEGSDLTLLVYDPNRPGDREVTLTTTIDRPDLFRWVTHNRKGEKPIRGFFLTGYTRPNEPPPGE